MKPVLYIIMRNDMESLNLGKAMAQAAHAANQFAEKAKSSDLYKNWKNQTESAYGTTIVLGGSELEINDLFKYLDENFTDEADDSNLSSVEWEWVVDPTYPLKDGEVTHLINLNTCAYVFFDADTDDEDLLGEMRWFDLHP